MDHAKNCLHCQVNKLIESHLESERKIDVTDMAAKLAESLAEMILFAAEPEDQGKLLAHTIVQLGGFVLEKSGATEKESTH
jgi:hypothetical protein